MVPGRSKTEIKPRHRKEAEAGTFLPEVKWPPEEWAMAVATVKTCSQFRRGRNQGRVGFGKFSSGPRNDRTEQAQPPDWYELANSPTAALPIGYSALSQMFRSFPVSFPAM